MNSSTLRPYSSKGLPHWAYIAVSLAIIIALIFHLWGQVVKELNLWDLGRLNYQEFLINFEGGPVRRGLFGELMLWVTQWTGLSPIRIIQIVSLAAYFLFTVWILLRSHRAGWCWWLALSPLMCGYVNDVIRKDYLQLLLLIPVLALCARQKLNNSAATGITLLLVIEIMLHEAFMFWGAPIPLLVILTQSRNRNIGIFYAFIVVIVFLVQCYWHGDAFVTRGIVASWHGICPSSETMTSVSFGGLDWDLLETINIHVHSNFYDKSVGWYLAAERLLVFLFNSFVVTQFAGTFSRYAGGQNGVQLNVRVTRVYLLIFLCLLPMFTILSCDYGRLYLYLTSSTVMACLVLPANVIDKATGWFFTSGIEIIVDKINHLMPLRTRQYMIAIMLFFVSESTTGFTWGRWLIQSVAGALWMTVSSSINHVCTLLN